MKIKLNPDQEIVNTIREGLKRTGGYCPCRRERTEATKCMCQEFKDQIADPGGTIVIERCLRQEHESGRRRFTISHKCAHYIMDRAVPSAAFHREFDGERDYTQGGLQKPVQLP
jgi:ferredoxin-thioredoxin reductase catalytic subunit